MDLRFGLKGSNMKHNKNKTNFSNMADKAAWERLQDEARIANELQKQGFTRTEALKKAKEFLERK